MPNFFPAAAWSISVNTMKPAPSLDFTAASKRETVSFTEKLLGFVMMPSLAQAGVTMNSAKKTNMNFIGTSPSLNFKVLTQELAFVRWTLQVRASKSA